MSAMRLIAAGGVRPFAELLAIGVGLIRRYGAQEPTVIQALLRMLTTVLTTGAPDLDMATAVQREANLLVAASEREVQEPADLAVVVYTEADTLRHALPARPAETSPARAAPGEQAPPPTDVIRGRTDHLLPRLQQVRLRQVRLRARHDDARRTAVIRDSESILPRSGSGSATPSHDPRDRL